MENLIKDLIAVAKRIGAAKTVLTGSREDGYEVTLSVKAKGAECSDEFSKEELKYIREVFANKCNINTINENLMLAKKELAIVNVCQNALGLSEFENLLVFLKEYDFRT